MDRETIPAPGGWGWPTGCDIAGPILPDLPDLQPGRTITEQLRAAIRSVPELIPTLTAKQLVDRYGVSRGTANDALRWVRS
jgi:hypothetical protein